MTRIALAAALALTTAWAAYAATLFQDDFESGTLDPVWLTEHPQNGDGDGAPVWELANGVLSQTNPQPGDPTYAIVQGDGWPETYGIQAKVRIDDWEDHDRSRAGVGVWLDPADNYNGYTWLIHERLTDANMEFLNDARGWFNEEETFLVEVGQWYWVQMFIDDTNIYGKVWADGDAEPADWLAVRAWAEAGATRPPTTFAGLNGGAGTTGGHSTASFDDVTVFDADGPDDPTAVEPNGKLATAWATLKR